MFVFLGLLGMAATYFAVDALLDDDDDPPAQETDTDDDTTVGDVIEDMVSDDLLEAGPENTTLQGGDGNDTLLGGPGEEDELFGGPGDDLLIDGKISTNGFVEIDARGGGLLNTVFEGEGGTLFGGEGNDTLLVAEDDAFGGPGDDSLSNFDEALVGPPDGMFTGELLGDPEFGAIRFDDAGTQSTLYGGDGDDQILASGVDAFGEAGNDTIFGSFDSFPIFNDIPPSTSQAGVLSGGDGDDVIFGNATRIQGDDGDDLLEGSDSDIFGGDGNDTISNSAFLYEGDSLIVSGNAGDDVIVARHFGDGSAQVFGGEGDDVIDARGALNFNSVVGGEGADTVLVRAGNDAPAFEESFTRVSFDPDEDMLVVDLPLTPEVPGQVPDTPVEVQVELLPVDDGDTLVKLSLLAGTGFQLQGGQDAEARYVLLSGVDPADVDPNSIYVRAVSDGQIVSQDGFPSAEDDPGLPAELMNLPSTGFEGFPDSLLVPLR